MLFSCVVAVVSTDVVWVGEKVTVNVGSNIGVWVIFVVDKDVVIYGVLENDNSRVFVDPVLDVVVGGAPAAVELCLTEVVVCVNSINSDGAV